MSSFKLPAIKGADTKALYKVIDRVQADHSGLDEESILEAETLWSVMTRVSAEVEREGLLPPIDAEEKQRKKHLKSLESKRKKVALLEAAEKVKGEFAEEEAELDAKIAAHEAANPPKAKRKAKPTGPNPWGNFRKVKAAERKAQGLPKWGMDEYGDAWGQLSEEAQAEYGPGGSKAPQIHTESNDAVVVLDVLESDHEQEEPIKKEESVSRKKSKKKNRRKVDMIVC